MTIENNLLNKAKDKLIFALDVPDRKQAEAYVKKLSQSVGCFKVGLELFIKEGPDVLKTVRDHSDADIFLDLKLHDIPATLSRALISAASHAKNYNVKYVTIHLEEGEALPKIPQEVKDHNLEILGVTMLTSISEEDLYRFDLNQIGENISNQISLFEESTHQELSRLDKIVIERAMQAEVSGCAGVICSGNEVGLINNLFPGIKAVVPGIRPKWSVVGNDDQSRVTTPGQAIERGADLIVIGRPIRDADNPKEAADRIREEIAEALQKK
jgi:orotidine-5'-phosphate decarboxylase